jgi:hypothetical protein
MLLLRMRLFLRYWWIMKIAIATEPESNVTVELVKRVSRLVAKGIPLKYAIAGEPVTRAEYEQKLREYPELAAIQGRAICEFLDEAIMLMFSAKNPGANIRWWLETVYPEMFGKSRKDEEEEGDEPEQKIQTIRGIPEEEIDRLRAMAPKASF